MFRKQTVFILGAGASVDYGYPTGHDLVKSIITLAQELADYCERASGAKYDRAPSAERPKYVMRHGVGIPGNHYHEWKTTEDECRQLAKVLFQDNPVLIDHFLAHHPNFAPLIKLLIALVILDREHRQASDLHTKFLNRAHRDDDWYRFLKDKLVRDCTSMKDFAAENRVNFITFNYDVSLERELYVRLCLTPTLNDSDAIKKFLEQRIFHVYGKIRTDFDQPLNAFSVSALTQGHNDHNISGVQKTVRVTLDRAYECSANIRAIAPNEKEPDKELLEIAQEALAKAEDVFICGFGYDPLNLEVLDLASHLRRFGGDKIEKNIHTTNFEDAVKIRTRFERLIKKSSKPNPVGQVLYATIDRQIAPVGVFQAFNTHFDLD